MCNHYVLKLEKMVGIERFIFFSYLNFVILVMRSLSVDAHAISYDLMMKTLKSLYIIKSLSPH
jgi:hypothetical protein